MDFRTVHDLTTLFANVDHVVIGPIGVFILDAKAWRGVVQPDGKEELLVNGQTTVVGKNSITQRGAEERGVSCVGVGKQRRRFNGGS